MEEIKKDSNYDESWLEQVEGWDEPLVSCNLENPEECLSCGS